jgi:SAM-dependent methyltransferase
MRVVVISSAWHWLDPDRAVPEITRVLRVGGFLGLIWMSRDARVPLVAEFNQLARESREADRPLDGEPARRRRTVEFPAGTPLSQPETFSAEYSLPMTSEQLFGLLGTYSGVITLDPQARADFARRVRAFLDRQPWDHVDLPMICRCLRSVRLPG